MTTDQNTPDSADSADAVTDEEMDEVIAVTAHSIAADAGIAFGLAYAMIAGCHAPTHDHERDHAPGTLADMINDQTISHVRMLVGMCSDRERYGAITVQGAFRMVMHTWVMAVMTIIPGNCRNPDHDHDHDHGAGDEGEEMIFGWVGPHGKVTLYDQDELSGPESDEMKRLIRVAGELYVGIVDDVDSPDAADAAEDAVAKLIANDVLVVVQHPIRPDRLAVDIVATTRRMVGLLSIYAGAYALQMNRMVGLHP